MKHVNQTLSSDIHFKLKETANKWWFKTKSVDQCNQKCKKKMRNKVTKVLHERNKQIDLFVSLLLMLN